MKVQPMSREAYAIARIIVRSIPVLGWGNPMSHSPVMGAINSGGDYVLWCNVYFVVDKGEAL